MLKTNALKMYGCKTNPKACFI